VEVKNAKTVSKLKGKKKDVPNRKGEEATNAHKGFWGHLCKMISAKKLIFAHGAGLLKPSVVERLETKRGDSDDCAREMVR